MSNAHIDGRQLHSTVGPPARFGGVSRRGFLRRSAAVTAAAAALTTGTVAADEDGDGESDDEDELETDEYRVEDYDDYVSQDRDVERYGRVPSAREAARMALLGGTSIGQMSLTAAGVTDAEASTRDYVHEYFFGPFQIPDSYTDDEALIDAWYDILSSQQQLDRDLDSWLNSFEPLESQAHGLIQIETMQGINAGETASEIEARCRNAVRRLYSTVENNLFVYVEEALLRVVGDYFLTASKTSFGAAPDFYIPSVYGFEDLHQPGMHVAHWRLMDGRVLETGVSQWLTEGGEDDGETLYIHPFIDSHQLDYAEDRWEFVPEGDDERDRFIVSYEPPSTISDESYRLFEYGDDDGEMDIRSRARDMLDLLYEQIQVLDDEIETFVADALAEYDAGDFPIEDVDATALAEQMGIDWQDTGFSGFAAMSAAVRGYSTNTDYGMDIHHVEEDRTYEDSMLLLFGPWSPDSSTVEYDDRYVSLDATDAGEHVVVVEGPPYDGEHVVVVEGEEPVVVPRAEISLAGEWDGDPHSLAFEIDLSGEIDADELTEEDIEYVEATVDEAVVAGETYTIPGEDDEEYGDEYIQAFVSTSDGLTEIPRSDEIEIEAIRNVDGEPVDSMAFRQGGQIELDTNATEEILTRHLWTQSRHQEAGGTAPGSSPSGDGGPSTGVLALAAGGVLAAYAYARGKEGGE
ncbi:hypothetical protein [Natrialbaceae archaeon AArc-T1-2]|uniref:hypothetical protein n=1 Tax=Natrialbaceae archaeon AArc-T1-2 TaxID=3053904 RepID=UPI00255A7554|nr:hypothetical protein [Natrialbaceae archaeon AArc-T1-2]WIV66559.1 hypothetical protein QQ977_12780 [Natrialbaceae archaeon AArc-T1-2]